MRKHTALITALTIALVVSLVWGYNQYSIVSQLTNNQENQFQQSYAELTNHMDNVENYLAKAEGSTSKGNNLVNYTGAWQEANAALSNVSTLPVKGQSTTYIANYLNQTSNFSYAMSQKIAAGQNMSAKDQSDLVTAKETARKTAMELHKLQHQHDDENLSWTGTATSFWAKATSWIGGKAEAETMDVGRATSVTQGLQVLDSQLQKLPPFSFQGPYSTVVTQQPKALPTNDVSQATALANANKFAQSIGAKYTLQYVGTAKGNIATYRFGGKGDVNLIISVSKRGGVPVEFNEERTIGPCTLTVGRAKVKAENYLHNLGYGNMVVTSSEDFGSYMNFAYVAIEDGVKIYPDKITLRIAMDNGQLLGYNAEAYLMFHHDRTLGKTKLTVAQARKALKANFKVKDTSLVLLAKDNYAEILCYEFRGMVNDEEFLSYINVSSGAEEQIYRVIKTPVGEYLR